ncbi:AMP-binding protein [Streptomyces goshikiensis]
MDFATVRAAVSAGERLTDELRERAAAFLGAPLYDQLGSTEAGHAIATNGDFFHEPGTVGRPVPGFEAEVRDRDGTPVPDGVAGELWVRGPTVTRGYLGLPEETARTLVEGWLNTRDRVVRGEDGTLTHSGRTDDLEMVGGITFSPLEIEQVLARHPAVRDIAVACVPNDRGASKLRAFVVAADGPGAVQGAARRAGRREPAAHRHRKNSALPHPARQLVNLPTPSIHQESSRSMFSLPKFANPLPEQAFYLGQLWEKAAAKFPGTPVTLDQPLATFPDLGTNFSYASLADVVDDLAARLWAIGIRPTERVAVHKAGSGSARAG